jgi:hypothetical protein
MGWLKKFVSNPVAALTDNKVTDVVKDAGRTYANVVGNIATGGLMSDLGYTDKLGLNRMNTGLGRTLNPIADTLSNYGSKAALLIGGGYALGGALGTGGALGAGGEIAVPAADTLATGGLTYGSMGAGGAVAPATYGGAGGLGSGALEAALSGAGNIDMPFGADYTGAAKTQTNPFTDALDAYKKGKGLYDQAKGMSDGGPNTQQQQLLQQGNSLSSPTWMNLGGQDTLAKFMKEGGDFSQLQAFTDKLNKKPEYPGF